jgi:hypothetical protein
VRVCELCVWSLCVCVCVWCVGREDGHFLIIMEVEGGSYVQAPHERTLHLPHGRRVILRHQPSDARHNAGQLVHNGVVPQHRLTKQLHMTGGKVNRPILVCTVGPLRARRI